MSLFCCLRNTEEGKTLVICCEGNAGFYEIGIMATPITCGYSTLGKVNKIQMKPQTPQLLFRLESPRFLRVLWATIPRPGEDGGGLRDAVRHQQARLQGGEHRGDGLVHWWLHLHLAGNELSRDKRLGESHMIIYLASSYLVLSDSGCDL